MWDCSAQILSGWQVEAKCDICFHEENKCFVLRFQRFIVLQTDFETCNGNIIKYWNRHRLLSGSMTSFWVVTTGAKSCLSRNGVQFYYGIYSKKKSNTWIRRIVIVQIVTVVLQVCLLSDGSAAALDDTPDILMRYSVRRAFKFSQPKETFVVFFMIIFCFMHLPQSVFTLFWLK